MSNQGQNAHDWRVVLQKIIQPTKERQRIADALGISPATLVRWAKHRSRPQQVSLARLVKIVQPQYKAELQRALKSAYPLMEEKFVDETFEDVPASFLRQILRDRAIIIETLQSWQLSATIINEALNLLDPHSLGMAITPVLCMPPIEGRIRSLREHGGRGTYPWTTDLEHKSIFLGMNSLAGYVVHNGRPASVRDVSKERYIPVFAYPLEWENSAAACPIWMDGKIAGCLLAVCLEVDHFTQARMDLLVNLTNLYALALTQEQFYEHHLVHLRYIPHPKHQLSLLQSFRLRSNQIMAMAYREGHSISTADAEKLAWQHIEDKLLTIGASMDETEAAAE